MKLGCHAVLFTDRISTDTDGVLSELRAAGAEGVEIGSRFFGIDRKQELNAALDRHGLRLAGLHVAQPLTAFLDNPEACGAALVQAARFLEGMQDRNIIMTGMVMPPAWNLPDLGDSRLTQSESVRRIAEALDDIAGRIRRAHDVQLRYHNHSWEFRNGGLIAYMLLEHAPELRFALDTGWAAVSGFNPMELIRSHPGRFGYVHLRDYSRTKTDGSSTFEELQNGYVDVGTGDMNYGLMMETLASELGSEEWAVVEYEKGEVSAARYAAALAHIRSVMR